MKLGECLLMAQLVRCIFSLATFLSSGAAYFDVASRHSPSRYMQIRSGDRLRSNTYSRRSNLLPSTSIGRSTYSCTTTSSFLPTAGLLHTQMPRPWQLACGFTMQNLSFRRSHKNESYSPGSTHVFGQNPYSSGIAACATFRFTDSRSFRPSSQLLGKWFIFWQLFSLFTNSSVTQLSTQIRKLSSKWSSLLQNLKLKYRCAKVLMMEYSVLSMTVTLDRGCTFLGSYLNTTTNGFQLLQTDKLEQPCQLLSALQKSLCLKYFSKQPKYLECCCFSCTYNLLFTGFYIFKYSNRFSTCFFASSPQEVADSSSCNSIRCAGPLSQSINIILLIRRMILQSNNGYIKKLSRVLSSVLELGHWLLFSLLLLPVPVDWLRYLPNLPIGKPQKRKGAYHINAVANSYQNRKNRKRHRVGQLQNAQQVQVASKVSAEETVHVDPLQRESQPPEETSHAVQRENAQVVGGRIESSQNQTDLPDVVSHLVAVGVSEQPLHHQSHQRLRQPVEEQEHPQVVVLPSGVLPLPHLRTPLRHRVQRDLVQQAGPHSSRHSARRRVDIDLVVLNDPQKREVVLYLPAPTFLHLFPLVHHRNLLVIRQEQKYHQTQPQITPQLPPTGMSTLKQTSSLKIGSTQRLIRYPSSVARLLNEKNSPNISSRNLAYDTIPMQFDCATHTHAFAAPHRLLKTTTVNTLISQLYPKRYIISPDSSYREKAMAPSRKINLIPTLLISTGASDEKNAQLTYISVIERGPKAG